MVQFNKPWMLCMILFIATVACHYTDEEVTIEDDDNTKITADDNYSKQKPQRRTFGLVSPIIQFVINTLGAFFPNWKDKLDILSFGMDEYPLPEGRTHVDNEYHYVIIGAGSAGSALASRLSEDRGIKVLLIEAGRPESVITDIPLMAPVFQRTEYATQYITEKQGGSCWGMEDQRCVWPRGRAVGGTSVINYMIYTRGRPQDWDRIYQDGNDGWSYNQVLPYFKKSEQCHVKKYQGLPYRGGPQGKLHVTDVSFRTRLVEAYIEAGRLLGHPTVDYNARNGFGFGYLQTNLRYGRRHSAARAYLYPHRDRPNLHILHSTTATKIEFDENNVAIGVHYDNHGRSYYVNAWREIILSAGPIASPQLLMLSGIGPADHLKSLGIHVVQDLQVGKTLYDHLFFPGQIYVLNTTSATIHESNAANIDDLVKWFNTGTGLLSSPGGIEGIGYIKTHVSDDPEQVPDIELMDIGGSILSDYTFGGTQSVRRGARITDYTFNFAFNSITKEDTWSATPMLLHPKSKGVMELRDKNPYSFPKIYTNYFTDHRDIETMIAAIRHVQKLTAMPQFQQFGARPLKAKYPQCPNEQFDTDAYWECALRTLSSSLHHQVGTCRMGPSSDTHAVVDQYLHVYGVYNLRVADTSVIPRTTSAHTNAPGMMIGEKAADLIKSYWQNSAY